MKKNLVTYLTAFLFLFVLGCGTGNTQSVGQKAPDFTANDINNNPIRLSSYEGNVIILNFFATWCPPCRMEMPEFNEIAQKYKDSVRIIAINVGNEGRQKVMDFADNYKLTFPVIADDGRLASLYGPMHAIPVSVVIDKDFNIAERYVGSRPQDVFEADIEKLR